ncbi:MAG: ABC transporter substrate-binding protein [Saprospiraceae bacterium]|nr:ABC transporter substrate-binding protein [Saprospiraceae bacterium]
MLLALSLVSCGGQSDSGNRVFRYNLPNNITSLDPAFARDKNNIWAVDHLFSTLVQFDDDMKIVPDIAKKWSISDDGRRYVFHLRNDVYFHENEVTGQKRRVVSADVVYSLSRLLSDTLNSPGSWVLSGKVRHEAPFATPNDSVFVLHLEKAFPPMLGILTMQYCSVVPHEIVEHYGRDFRRHAIGTGLFKLAAWKENQGLFLSINHQYHFPVNTNLEGVEVSFISDRKTVLLEMLSGGLHFQSGMDPAYKAILLNNQGNLLDRHQDKLKIIKSPYLNTEYLGINLALADKQDHPLSDLALRKALNYGLNKKRMMASLRYNFGVPAQQGFIPKGMYAYDKDLKGYSYDQDSAIHYLKASSYDGQEIILHTNGDYVDLCLYAARQWQNIGINVRVELLESSLLREMMRKGEVVFFRASWIGDYPDDETFLTVFHGEKPAPPNYTRFHKPSFDSLYDHALETSDPRMRRVIYRQMDSIIVENAPVVFLYYDETLLLSSSAVEGISRNAFNLMRLDSIRLTQD